MMISIIPYILYINPIGYPGEVTLQVSDLIHNYWEHLTPLPELKPTNLNLPSNINSAKFMDDATIQEAIDLNTVLATKLDRSGPLPW